MSRFRKVFILVGIVLLGGFAALSPRSQATVEPASAGSEFFLMLNGLRSAQGKSTLQRDPGLDALATEWAGHMADVYDRTRVVRTPGLASSSCDSVSALCHRTNLGAAASSVEPNWRSTGENVGTGGAVTSLHEAFVQSPGHYANMVGNFNRVGVGVVVRNGRIWVAFNYLLGPDLAPSSTSTGTTEASRSLELTGPAIPPLTAVGTRANFRAVDPQRIADTRIGLAGTGPIASSGTLRVPFSNLNPPAGATGAALTVTATGTQDPGFLTVYPCGAPLPVSSNVNFLANQSVPNLVAAPFGSNSEVCIFTSAKTHLIVDLAGWFGMGLDSSMTTTAPVRLLDSRAGGTKSKNFAVSMKSVSPDDASAATVNITVTAPESDGFLTAYPCGGEVPVASTVNFRAGQTAPNLAVVRIGSNRSVCFFSSAPTHLIIDSAGWFGGSGGVLNPVVPVRVLDTRVGVGDWSGRLGVNQTIELDLGSLSGLPVGTNGAIMNFTVTGGSGGGFVTVYPCGTATPNASNLNFESGQTVANLVAVSVPASGTVCIYASARVHIIADLSATITAA